MDIFNGAAVFARAHPAPLLAGAGALLIALPLFLILIRAWREASRETGMLENAWSATATIEEVWGTGGMAGHSPFMGMKLEVRHPAGSTYKAEIKETIVPAIHVHRLTPGAVVPVKIARDDQTVVALDIDAEVNNPSRH